VPTDTMPADPQSLAVTRWTELMFWKEHLLAE
jgi:hypothetical protein